MGTEGQPKSQAKRVRFDMPNMEASTPTAGNLSLAKARDRGSPEPTPMSAKPIDQHRRRTSCHTTCATQSTRYEIQPVSGRGQDVYLKREDRSDTTRMPRANRIRVQISSSNVDRVVVGFTTCRLKPASTTIANPMARHGLRLCSLV